MARPFDGRVVDSLIELRRRLRADVEHEREEHVCEVTHVDLEDLRTQLEERIDDLQRELENLRDDLEV